MAKPIFFYRLRQKDTGVYYSSFSHYYVCGFGKEGKRFDDKRFARAALYDVETERKEKAALWKKYGYPRDKTEEQCKAILERLNKSNYEIVKFQELEIGIVT